MEFFTQYTWSDTYGEWNCGKTIVDPSGYISPQQRIDNLIRAGQRLEEFRREQYDYDHGDSDDGVWMDPLRTPGLDLSDVSRIQSVAMDRLRRRKPPVRESGNTEVRAENQTATPEVKPDAEAAEVPS